MKILTAGTKGCGSWWQGMIITCTRCCQVVELQAGDEALPQVSTVPGLIRLQCTCCGHYSYAYEPHTCAAAPINTAAAAGQASVADVGFIGRPGWNSDLALKKEMQQERKT